MCGGGGGSAPKPAPMLPQAPVTPDVQSSMSGVDAKGRKRKAAGGTILTGSQGVVQGAPTAQKTLLGA